MSSERRGKINSVLAQFEETIEKNNAVGVCSGMYLTTQVGRPKKLPSTRRRSETGPQRPSDSRSARRASCVGQIKPGMYRDMMISGSKGMDHQEEEEKDDGEWDPFGTQESESAGNDWGEDDDDDDSSQQKKTKLQRPKTQKSAGRIKNRKTRTKGCAPKRGKSTRDQPSGSHEKEQTFSVDTCTTKSESDDDDSDEGSVFSLTYVGDRDKYADLQRQSSDRRMQSSSKNVLRGGRLEMARQDSSSSLTRKSSRVSHASRSSDPLGGTGDKRSRSRKEADEDSSCSASHSKSSSGRTRPTARSPSKRMTSSRTSSRPLEANEETPSPRRRIDGRTSSRNFAKTR